MRGKFLFFWVGFWVSIGTPLFAENRKSILPPIHDLVQQERARPQSEESSNKLFISCKVKWKGLDLQTCIRMGKNTYGVVQNTKTGLWGAAIGDEVVYFSTPNAKSLLDIFFAIPNLPRHYSDIVQQAAKAYGYYPRKEQSEGQEEVAQVPESDRRPRRQEQRRPPQQQPGNLSVWKDALEGRAPGVVLFTATWCGPCNQLKSSLRANENRVKQNWRVPTDTPIYIVDIDQYRAFYEEARGKYHFADSIPRAIFKGRSIN